MKLQSISFLLTLVMLSAGSLYSYEIVVIGGAPNEAIEFIPRMLTEKIILTEDSNEQSSTTITYSILNDYGIQDTALIMVLDKDGTTSTNLVSHAVELAASRTPVVVTNLGPMNDEICQLFAKHSNTTFVIVPGNQGISVDRLLSSSCLAGNILLVAALDQTREDLLSFSNWGLGVRIASPSSQIEVVSSNGNYEKLDSATAGLSIAAAQLALLAKQHPSLHGASLIDYLLEHNTIVLPSLIGKIQGGLSLRK